MSNLLFVCSKNQWRSPTAEMLFKGHPIHSARSAGTSDKARIKVSQRLLDWADVVFVMERRHKERLFQRFLPIIQHKEILVLEIEDKYRFDDPELKEILKTVLAGFL